jgi:hypothetical protein
MLFPYADVCYIRMLTYADVMQERLIDAISVTSSQTLCLSLLQVSLLLTKPLCCYVRH